MTTAQLLALVTAGLTIFVVLLWGAYDAGRRSGRIEAYSRIGQEFRKGRTR